MGFTPVRTDRVFINKDTSTIYQIEFQDFILKPQEAVELVIPVTFSTDGYFQLQFKTYGQAIPIYEGDGEGDFTLTSGRDTYGWLNIEEPLDYRVTTFFGDDPTEELPPEERRGSFNYAPLWRRAVIVIAGPAFNLLLPLLIFFPMFLTEGEHMPPVLAEVEPGGPAAAAGLRSGDAIIQISGADGTDSIGTWWEMERRIAASAGEPLDVVVLRDGRPVGPIRVVPEDVVVRRIEELDWEERKGRIQVKWAAIAPVVSVEPGSAAERAGLRTGDRLVAIDGVPLADSSVEEALRLLTQRLGHTVEVIASRAELPPPREMLGVRLTDLWDPVLVRLPVENPEEGGVSGLRSAELVVGAVEPESTAHQDLHLLPGDRLLALDGERLRSWAQLATKLRARPKDEHAIRFERGAVFDAAATWEGPRAALAALVVGAPAWDLVRQAAAGAPRVVEGRFHLKPVGRGAERIPIFGVQSALDEDDYIVPASVPIRHRLWYASVRTLEDSWETTKLTVLTLVGLFRGRVPVKDLGGPLLIADLAAKTQERGWGYFFTLMVWLSINLGLINLLPVPILDGGHLMFFAIEAVRRKQPSLRTRQLASYVGLAIIVLLMAVAFKNDLERYWESIAGGVGCSVVW